MGAGEGLGGVEELAAGGIGLEEMMRDSHGYK